MLACVFLKKFGSVFDEPTIQIGIQTFECPKSAIYASTPRKLMKPHGFGHASRFHTLKNWSVAVLHPSLNHAPHKNSCRSCWKWGNQTDKYEGKT
jgi:hypothetical protein